MKDVGLDMLGLKVFAILNCIFIRHVLYVSEMFEQFNVDFFKLQTNGNPSPPMMRFVRMTLFLVKAITGI